MISSGGNGVLLLWVMVPNRDTGVSMFRLGCGAVGLCCVVLDTGQQTAVLCCRGYGWGGCSLSTCTFTIAGGSLTLKDHAMEIGFLGR